MGATTVGELCERLRRDPARALGARSPGTLDAYLLGYASALEHHGKAPLLDETGGFRSFCDWVLGQVTLSREHGSRLNAMSALSPASIALLASEDEHAAFETFLALRARCVEERGSMATPYATLGEQPTLLRVLAAVRKRPGMYFGDKRVVHCWALVNGYADAEVDHGVSSTDTARLQNFQVWVDERYPFGRGQPWFRVFRLLAIDPSRECEVFFGDLDVFLAGHPPDAPDRAMTEMLASILATRRDDGAG